jgi:hypothetical protein
MPVHFGELPPSDARATGAWRDEAAELRDRPGEWAVVATMPSNRAAAMTANIRLGKLAAFRPAGTFEATKRGEDVWVRYVGDGTGRDV